MQKILFVCAGDSALGQIAQGLARDVLGPDAELVSTGSESFAINPHAVEVMKAIGIDISVQQFISDNAVDYSTFDLVVSLGAEGAPTTIPDQVRRLHWSIAEPASDDPSLTLEDMRARFRATRDMVKVRIDILKGLLDLPAGPTSVEFHSSIRVHSLSESVRFYAWLLDTWPKEWTHRYATFIRADLKLNFVLLVSDDKELHHDTLYHLGVGVADRNGVIDAYHRALAVGAYIEKPPRTTWLGTPLHELWLKDPDGNLIEIYSRVCDVELAQKPQDLKPVFLVPGTAPQ